MPALPYENTTSGEKAVQDIQKVLRAFGCDRFGQMMDYAKGELLMQFEYRGRPVSVKANVNGYAAAWLKAHPHSANHRVTIKVYEKKAVEIASIAVYSILRDWIKGQITAIETGVLSFEGAFLAQLVLPDGRTVLERVSKEKILPQLESKP